MKFEFLNKRPGHLINRLRYVNLTIQYKQRLIFSVYKLPPTQELVTIMLALQPEHRFTA